jgi:uncharacterized protein (UPF0371 family)
MRADFGITYDVDALKLIDDLREWGCRCGPWSSPASTSQPAAVQFKNKLERGASPSTPTATPRATRPTSTGRQRRGLRRQRVHRDRQAARGGHRPGPGQRQAGHLPVAALPRPPARRGGGYAKFETFPIWNLPLKHPVNVAYEAATADISDVQHDRPVPPGGLRRDRGQLQPRRRGIFPVLKRILERITGSQASTARPRTWA